MPKSFAKPACLLFLILLSGISLPSLSQSKSLYQQKANIIWILSEDISTDLGCDGTADPYELNNQAAGPGQQQKGKEMRTVLDTWIKETGGKGQYPESAEAARLKN